MKKLFLVAAMAILAGCTTRTDFGNCIGVAGDKKPGLEYKLSIKNTVLAVIFSETIVVPVVVLVDNTYCPVSRLGEGTK